MEVSIDLGVQQGREKSFGSKIDRVLQAALGSNEDHVYADISLSDALYSCTVA